MAAGMFPTRKFGEFSSASGTCSTRPHFPQPATTALQVADSLHRLGSGVGRVGRLTVGPGTRALPGCSGSWARLVWM